MCKDDIQALLREFCDAPLRRWVKEVLKKRYQASTRGRPARLLLVPATGGGVLGRHPGLAL